MSHSLNSNNPTSSSNLTSNQYKNQLPTYIQIYLKMPSQKLLPTKTITKKQNSRVDAHLPSQLRHHPHYKAYHRYLKPHHHSDSRLKPLNNS